MKRVLLLIFLVHSCKCLNECALPQDIVDDIASYGDVAKQILSHFTDGPYKGKAWKLISDFVDTYGMRLTGTNMLEDAIDFMVQSSLDNGLENVHTEELDVPFWLRGKESATLLKPRMMNLPILGLGTSIGTPLDGITANGIVVESFEELHSLPDNQVRGKIVIFNQPYSDYSSSVDYRYDGAVESAKKGAVASLIRSIAPFSIATPHTGAQEYQVNVTKIPAACITVEDAEYLLREQRRGNGILINLKMSPTEKTKKSRNMVADLTGSTQPEKVVMITGHIDSWDVGTGAMDDAGGCFVSWLAPVILKQLNLRPKRTLRTILFTAEEQGIIGAKAYAEKHESEEGNLTFVMESDFGNFEPLGLVYSGSEVGECMMHEILKHFESIHADELVLGNPGADIKIWTRRGIPGVGLNSDDFQYFWYHHSAGDTMNVLKSEELDKNAGFWAAVAYILADMKYEVPKIV